MICGVMTTDEETGDVIFCSIEDPEHEWHDVDMGPDPSSEIQVEIAGERVSPNRHVAWVNELFPPKQRSYNVMPFVEEAE